MLLGTTSLRMSSSIGSPTVNVCEKYKLSVAGGTIVKLDTYAHRGGGLRKTEDVTVMCVTKRDSFRRQPFGMIK